jgi:hypothetical protein
MSIPEIEMIQKAFGVMMIRETRIDRDGEKHVKVIYQLAGKNYKTLEAAQKVGREYAKINRDLDAEFMKKYGNVEAIEPAKDQE